MAEELLTISRVRDQEEFEGRIRLLEKIAFWNLQSNVQWPQVRNAYAVILRDIENHLSGWECDYIKYKHILHERIQIKGEKNEKIDKWENKKTRQVWFCKAFQTDEGCNEESNH